MKRALLLIMATTVCFGVTSVEAKGISTGNTKTVYLKETEYNDVNESLVLPSLNNLMSQTIELSKKDYYNEINSVNNSVVTLATISTSNYTSYKTLTISYQSISGGKYKVSAKVDWDVMPYYRRIDHLGTTHSAQGYEALKNGTLTYIKGGTTYIIQQNNPIGSYNVSLYSNGQIVDHDLPDNSTNSTVTDIKFEVSYEIQNNPSSDLCAVIYHQDTATNAYNYLARYFYGKADIRYDGYNMETLYSIQSVCF